MSCWNCWILMNCWMKSWYSSCWKNLNWLILNCWMNCLNIHLHKQPAPVEFHQHLHTRSANPDDLPDLQYLTDNQPILDYRLPPESTDSHRSNTSPSDQHWSNTDIRYANRSAHTYRHKSVRLRRQHIDTAAMVQLSCWMNC